MKRCATRFPISWGDVPGSHEPKSYLDCGDGACAPAGTVSPKLRSAPRKRLRDLRLIFFREGFTSELQGDVHGRTEMRETGQIAPSSKNGIKPQTHRRRSGSYADFDSRVSREARD